MREILTAMGKKEQMGARKFEAFIRKHFVATDEYEISYDYDMFLGLYNSTVRALKNAVARTVQDANPRIVYPRVLPDAQELFDKYAYVDCSRRVGIKTLGIKELREILILMGKKEDMGARKFEAMIADLNGADDEWDVAYTYGKFLGVYNMAAKPTRHKSSKKYRLSHVPPHVMRIIRTTPAPQNSATAASDPHHAPTSPIQIKLSSFAHYIV